MISSLKKDLSTKYAAGEIISNSNRNKMNRINES